MPSPRPRPRGHCGDDAAAAGPRRGLRCGRARRRSTDFQKPMVGRFPPRAGADSPLVMPETRAASRKLKWWPRGGIEPTTREFSVRRRARFRLTNPTTRKGFLAGRPNAPARPSAYRTGTPQACSARRSAHADQRLARDRTELFPNLRGVETLVTAPPVRLLSAQERPLEASGTKSVAKAEYAPATRV